MFKEERVQSMFKWDDLGDLDEGRPNLGMHVPVLNYRLLQYTLRDVLIHELGVQRTNDMFIRAGRSAGYHFCKNVLNPDLGFNEFVSELQKKLKDNKIGILRVEHVDLDALKMTFTVSEDLDCSGLPLSNEVICHYAEGFIAGILEAYTGKKFCAKEVDCWASGERVCRFEVRLSEDEHDS